MSSSMGKKRSGVPSKGNRSKRVPRYTPSSSQPSSSQNPIDSLNPSWFKTPDAKTMFSSFAPYKQLQYYFDFKGFTLNLKSIKTWFKKLGLHHFVTQKFNTYEDMVKMFYANLFKTPSISNVVTTNVCGIRVHLTASIIAEIFKIPDSGIDIIHNDFAFDDFYQVICDNPNRTSLQKPSYTELTAETRILFFYFSHFLGKQGNLTDFPKTEQRLVYCVKSGRSFNLPRLILHIMIQRQAFRPFHMLLTPIFTHLQIPLYGEGFILADQCINLSKVLFHMRIERRDDQFVIKHGGGVGQGGDQEASDDDSEVGEMLYMEEYIEDRLTHFQMDINSQFDGVNARIDAMNVGVHARIDSMSGQLSDIMAHLQNMSFPPPGADI